MKTVLAIILAVVMIATFIGCSPADTVTEDIYLTGSVYSYNGTDWIELTQPIILETTLTGEYDLMNGAPTDITGLLYGNGSTISAVTKPTGDIAGTTDTQEFTDKTYTNPIFKGTATTDGTFTMPAFTLGDTIILAGKTLDADNNWLRLSDVVTWGGIWVSGDWNGTEGVVFRGQVLSDSPATNDHIFSLHAYGKDSDADNTSYGYLDFRIEDPTSDGSGKLRIRLAQNGGLNDALTLSSAGVLAVDDSYDTFDEYDDAEILREGISKEDKELLKSIGVLKDKEDDDGNKIDGEYMIQLQPLLKLVAGGVYQNRDYIELLEDRIDKLEKVLEK